MLMNRVIGLGSNILRISMRAVHAIGNPCQNGVVIGTYQCTDSKDDFLFTKDGENFCTEDLLKRISSSGPVLKKGQYRLLSPLVDGQPFVAVVGLGLPVSSAISAIECRDISSERARTAVAAGISALRQVGVTNALVDCCDGESVAAAEASELCQWSYDDLKSEKSPPLVVVKPLAEKEADNFLAGTIAGKGQNIARTLMEAPANVMTPLAFAEKAAQLFADSRMSTTVTARNREWAMQKQMGAFLSVSAGSVQEPVFLEIDYNGPSCQKESPIVLVGKGVTFDSGGISLKPSKSMDKMRGDMGGAACVVGAILTIAELKLPCRIVGIIPLCENMPGGKATKPGDVVRAMNGKTIQVDNTDAEGRLILADALCYASRQFKPRLIVDLATLTGAMAVALGTSAAGVYTNSDRLWPLMSAAGYTTGDRMWRMPLWEMFLQEMKVDCKLADMSNISSSGYGGSCSAAAFLKEFVECDEWFHIDIAGVMEHTSPKSYPCLGQNTGMSGRPTRTIVEFVKGLIRENF